MAEPLVNAEGVRKSFGPIEVLKDISLTVHPGQVLCVIGPSGSGKSTFIRCINHLEKIDGGRLLVDGHLVGYRRVGTKLYELRESEIARAGLLSVDAGQGEAAAALGMSRSQAMRRIILPQAMRVIIPPTGNETISMLKTSSLVSVIGVQDLLGAAELIYGSNGLQIPLLVVASIWYLIMTSVLSIGQYFIEKRFSRGTKFSTDRPGRRALARALAARRADAAGQQNG